jgi:hypothetical protein
MIAIFDSQHPKIIFSIREEYKGDAKQLEFELIYGHRCPICGNVIQALFKTPKPINLWPYEATAILSSGTKNAGEIRRIIPDDKSKYGDSCYESTFHLAGGGSQKIRLKNHIMRVRVLEKMDYTGEGLFEVGERCCPKTGIFSVRKDLLMKDLCLFSMMLNQKVNMYNLPDIEAVIPNGIDNKIGQTVKAIGNAPPVVLVDRTMVVHGFTFYLEPRLEQYKKEAVKKTV